MSFICDVIHMAISVIDLKESIEWYHEVLGFELVKDPVYANMLHARVAFLRHPAMGMEIELFEHDTPHIVPWIMPDADVENTGFKHLAFRTERFDEFKQFCVDHDVTITQELHRGRDSVLFVKDCNGANIEIFQHD